jgi:hypothetical protein
MQLFESTSHVQSRLLYGTPVSAHRTWAIVHASSRKCPGQGRDSWQSAALPPEVVSQDWVVSQEAEVSFTGASLTRTGTPCSMRGSQQRWLEQRGGSKTHLLMTLLVAVIVDPRYVPNIWIPTDVYMQTRRADLWECATAAICLWAPHIMLP